VLSLVMRSFSILCAEALLLLSSFTLTISINTFHYLDILLYFYCCYIFIPVLPAGSQAVYVTQNSPAHSSRDGRRAHLLPALSTSSEILWTAHSAMDAVQCSTGVTRLESSAIYALLWGFMFLCYSLG
jgi:hypothetical protein